VKQTKRIISFGVTSVRDCVHCRRLLRQKTIYLLRYLKNRVAFLNKTRQRRALVAAPHFFSLGPSHLEPRRSVRSALRRCLTQYRRAFAIFRANSVGVPINAVSFRAITACPPSQKGRPPLRGQTIAPLPSPLAFPLHASGVPLLNPAAS